MKILYFLLVLPLIAFGWIDDNGLDSSIPIGEPPVGNDAIVLTYIGGFQVASAGNVLGLNMQYNSSQFGMVDNIGDKILGINCTSGAELWYYDINYTSGMGNFGTAHDWPVPYGWYLNSWTDTDMHYCDSGVWSVPFTNPAGTNGRGMSFEVSDDHLWQTDGSDGIYRIASGGSFDYFSTPEVSGQMSGLATFQHSGHTWVVVTCYLDQTFYFYDYTGFNLNFIGTADPGATGISLSYGLTYSNFRDTFFWSYEMPGGICWVAELGYSITALEQDTWGSIKTQF
ncbi:MAG: hypothetical protein K8S24_00180 [Candidatus Aegiribacteria sp.]|nr:hypothetical protein [Candidatus Aegiribacteria sp.]